MSFQLVFSKKSQKEFKKLDPNIQRRIHVAIKEKLLVNPDQYLISLAGDLKFLYKFRVGDYRLICRKEAKKLVILVVAVKHRKEVYKAISSDYL